MEWWYKSDRYSVTNEKMNLLKELLQNELVKIDSLQIANLYDDHEFFYIKTSNNITLHTFLFIHGFEEIYDEKYSPKDYIFYGRKKEEPMCRATVNRIIRNANFVLKTKETITPHTFRHSFATMLTEEGESLYTVKKY